MKTLQVLLHEILMPNSHQLHMFNQTMKNVRMVVLFLLIPMEKNLSTTITNLDQCISYYSIRLAWYPVTKGPLN